MIVEVTYCKSLSFVTQRPHWRFIISTMAGSRVQIGALPVLSFVIVYGIVQNYGVSGLIIATFMAGIMLIIIGLQNWEW